MQVGKISRLTSIHDQRIAILVLALLQMEITPFHFVMHLVTVSTRFRKSFKIFV